MSEYGAISPRPYPPTAITARSPPPHNVFGFQHKAFATEYRLSKHTCQHKPHHHYCHKMHAAIQLWPSRWPEGRLKAGSV